MQAFESIPKRGCSPFVIVVILILLFFIGFCVWGCYMEQMVDNNQLTQVFFNLLSQMGAM